MYKNAGIKQAFTLVTRSLMNVTTTTLSNDATQQPQLATNYAQSINIVETPNQLIIAGILIVLCLLFALIIVALFMPEKLLCCRQAQARSSSTTQTTSTGGDAARAAAAANRLHLLNASANNSQRSSMTSEMVEMENRLRNAESKGLQVNMDNLSAGDRSPSKCSLLPPSISVN